MPRIRKITRCASTPNVQDPWIEAYLEAGEYWRIQVNAEGIVLNHLRHAWGSYGKYCTSGDPFFRWSAWSAIQMVAERLAHLQGITSKEAK
jgi:hypothetical protein